MKILFILTFLFSLTVSATAQQFSDVPITHPYYAQIESVASRGIMIGFGDGTFRPDSPLPRFQAAVVIERAIGVFVPPETNVSSFEDVDYKAYYRPFIEDAAARGITKGCSYRLFCPYDLTTREQIAAFILRAKGEFNPAPPLPGTFRFLDVPASSPFYAFIHRLRELGITSGCGEALYCPSRAVTRGEMAVLVSRSFPLN